MLVIHPSSSCDICLETYFEIDASGQKRIPHATECGHVFCKQCIDSLPRLLCPLCRAYLDPRAIRRLHVETTPATTPSALSYPIKSESDPDEKESLKARLIAMVREGADGSRFQALLHEACTWLRDRSHDDEVSRSPLGPPRALPPRRPLPADAQGPTGRAA
ncbi:hypothetical protein OF83DRAFT_111087 [Amylostereum chailletii]|nr:hypothetical protein OF83DRAFT_111087 [Amylostereum chailletii]